MGLVGYIIILAGNTYAPGPFAAGAFLLYGAGGRMRPTRGDGMLGTPDAAKLVGVKPVTIRSWRRKGFLVPQGLDERGYPLHTPRAVRDAERQARENGLRASGIDPRQLRGRNETSRVFPAAA
jgi:MerR HTH family regulatory protein